MSQYTINIGALPNDGTGDPLRTAFNEVNLNFNQVFAAGPVLSNIQIANNSILTLNTNGNLLLSPNGVGKVVSATDIIPSVTLARNLGSLGAKWNTIYGQYLNVASANIGSFGNLTVDVGNLHILGGNNGYVLQTDGTGNLTWTAQTGGSGNGTPGGANTQIQYNDAGAFGGTAGFTFDNTSNTLSAVKINTTDIFNSNGIILENSDLTQGATAAVVIPTNGSSDTIQVNNTYGNIALQTGAGSGITASWLFNSDGSLSLPAGNLVGLGNVIGPGNISYPFGPGPILLANTAENNGAYFSLTAVANATGVLGYMGMAQFGANSSTGLIETVDDTGVTHDWYFNPDGTTAFPAYTFPNTDGTSGQVPTTYGNGQIYWANVSSNTIYNGSSNVSIPGADGNVYINANASVDNQWIFGTNGQTTAPDGTITGPIEGVNTFGFYNPSNITNFIFETGNNYWQFNSNTSNIESGGGISVAGNVTAASFTTSGAQGNITGANAISAVTYTSPGNVQITSGSSTWVFDTLGSLELPVGGGEFTSITAANAYPELVAYGSGGHGGPELDWMNADDPANTFGNVNTLRNTLYINNSGLYVGLNENNTAGTYTGNLSLSSTDGTLSVSANISTAGNIVGAYLWGDGSNISGVSANTIYNGLSNVTIPVANGNVTVNTNAGTDYPWTFGTDGELYLPSGGRLGFAGKGWTGLDGGNGNPVSLTSFYANGFYAGCVTNNTDGNVIISTYTGDGLQGSWTFDNGANLVLAPTNGGAGGAGSGEAAKLRGTRKIVNGYTNSYAFSTVLNIGGTPTVAYTATDNSVMSVKITFAVEGANGVWEQFDVSAVIDSTGNDINFTVSNRVKRDNAIPDTVVTAAVDGSDRITISLNLDGSQTGGWSSFDAVEFGLMVG